LHEGVRYVEHEPTVNALTLKRRKQRLVTQLKKLGYSVQLTPITASEADLSFFSRVWQGRKRTLPPMPIGDFGFV
jgi:hypothetical protein